MRGWKALVWYFGLNIFSAIELLKLSTWITPPSYVFFLTGYTPEIAY